MSEVQSVKSNSQWAVEIEDVRRKIESSPDTVLGSVDVEKLSGTDLAQLIDHTLLKLDATPEQIEVLIDEAIKYNFKTICIRLPYVQQGSSRLQTGRSGVCCVIGFHEGTYTTNEKLKEAKDAVAAGAVELDFVLNRGPLQAGQFETVYHELATLRSEFPPATSTNQGVTTKLILETSQLSQEEIIAASYLGLCAGFDFIKTSTGFLGHGAKIEHVKLMRQVANFSGYSHAEVKASGGIRTWEDAKAMVQAGATRLGVSAGVAIVEGFKGVRSGGNEISHPERGGKDTY